MTAENLTAQVLRAYAGTPDPRLRELLSALIRHLHAVAVETAITPAEWRAAIEFLTAVGQTCDAHRQEFILLSDVLGLSSLIETINAADGATEPTVLGPFYLPGAPHRNMGDQIGRAEDGEPALIRGRVTDTAGRPLEQATLDVWQGNSNGLYDIQDSGQPLYNLRGIFTTGPDGHYSFRTIRPVSYPVPIDGPVGEIFRVSGRHNFRAAHVHVIVSAAGYLPVTTHIFDSGNEFLDSDAVFGVRDSLIKDFRGPAAGDPADVSYVVDADFVLGSRPRVH